MTPEEIQRIVRDWGALMSAQNSLAVAMTNMSEHLQKLIDAVQPPAEAQPVPQARPMPPPALVGD